MNTVRLFLVGVHALFSLIAVADTNDTEIVSGVVVAKDSIFARSTISIGDSKKADCSASIIAPRVMLTAGHCLYFSKEAYAYFGIESKTAIKRKIEKWIIHEGFNFPPTKPEGMNDIALALLEEVMPLTFSATLLASPGDDPDMGEWATVAGYGITDLKAEDAGILRMTQYARKDKMSDPTDYIGTGELGFSAEPGVICSGDSGGPTYVNRGGNLVQVGISSRADCKAEAIVTRVSYFRAWIREVVRMWGQGT